MAVPQCRRQRAISGSARFDYILPQSSPDSGLEEDAIVARDLAVAAAKKSNGKPSPKHNIEAVRQAYYDRIAKHDLKPLWKVMNSIVTKEPVTRCAAVVWHFDDIKALVMESGGLISAEEAERRVLILENPALKGESRATNTLFAGVQMILPG
jgi:gentisate 1,2-dioxygenase